MAEQKENSTPRLTKRGVSLYNDNSAPVSCRPSSAVVGHRRGKPILSFRRGLSIPQILDSFPDEARELIPRHINRLNKIISPYKKWIDGVYQGAYSEFDKWFIVRASICCGAPTAEINYLEKLKKLRSVMNYAGDSFGKISSADILKAKYVPITSLVECKRQGGRWWARCPLGHDDDTPSFLINKNNTFKCFSCQQSGDSIELVRKLYGYNFVEAVRYLCKL